MKIPRFMLITPPDVGSRTTPVRDLLLHPDLASVPPASWMLQWRDLDGRSDTQSASQANAGDSAPTGSPANTGISASAGSPANAGIPVNAGSPANTGTSALLELRSELETCDWNEGSGPVWQINAGLPGAVNAAHHLKAGLHFPENARLPADIDRVHGPVGRSTHSLDAARAAQQEGVDYILFGPIFATPSKAAYGLPQGLKQLQKVAAAVSIPVLAVGGIDLKRIAKCLDTGAHGVAVIREVWDSREPSEMLLRLVAAADPGAFSVRGTTGAADEDPGARSVGAPSSGDPEAVELPIEDFIDLHFFRPKEILDVVDAYLEAAQEAGFIEVRLIHGKGKGFQRDRIQKMLDSHDRVDSFRDAPAHRGHWGATIVTLVKSSR